MIDWIITPQTEKYVKLAKAIDTANKTTRALFLWDQLHSHATKISYMKDPMEILRQCLAMTDTLNKFRHRLPNKHMFATEQKKVTSLAKKVHNFLTQQFKNN